MILKLNHIAVDCVIGERPDERTRRQNLRVDVELTIRDTASESDRLQDTVDYATLAERIREALVRAQCQMIERAARIVSDVCLEDPCVISVRATVTKTGAIPCLESASATFEGKRT